MICEHETHVDGMEQGTQETLNHCFQFHQFPVASGPYNYIHLWHYSDRQTEVYLETNYMTLHHIHGIILLDSFGQNPTRSSNRLTQEPPYGTSTNRYQEGTHPHPVL